MRVLQFAFGGDARTPSCRTTTRRTRVVYTGTHDNDTTAGWFAALSKEQQTRVARYIPGAATDPAGALLRTAWSSVAQTAIAPLQDVLGLGSEARMNTPGTSTGNWGWRVTPKQLKTNAFERLAEMTETYGRVPS